MNVKKIMGHVMLSVLLGTVLASCNFISSLSESSDPDVSMSMSRSSVSVSVGGMEVLDLSVSDGQNSRKITWSYDESVILAKTDNYGAVITGLSPGSTKITARCDGSEATAYVTVSEDSYSVTVTNPYVYASRDYIELTPGSTERISASLFGGTSADINGFSWICDKPSVVSLSTEGNYCWATGNGDGTARITVKHSKAAYGYSVIASCTADGSRIPYVTTDTNVLTLNLSEENTADISVDIVNPVSSDYESGFSYSVVDFLGQEFPASSAPVSVISAQGSSFTVSANSVGQCYVRCTHPDCIYTLDILVNVVKDAATAIIEPTSTLVMLSGDAEEYVELNLKNYAGEAEPSLFTWSVPDNADEYISYDIYNGSEPFTGDRIRLKGKKTGSVKLEVSYPELPSRTIIAVVRNQASEAASATSYITTEQPYMRIYLDEGSRELSVLLTDCSPGDAENISYKVTSEPSDGSSSAVISLAKGSLQAVTASSSARAASSLSYSESASAVIEALACGTAYIDVSHPKALYSTRIKVDVVERKAAAVTKGSLSLTGSPVVSVMNGETASLSVSYSGSGSESDISWIADGNASVAGNGRYAAVAAPAAGSGGARTTVTASHPDSDWPVTFSVITYDTEEELEQLKPAVIYAADAVQTLYIGNNTVLRVMYEGFDSVPSVEWKCTQGLNDIVCLENTDNPLEMKVTGKSSGQAVISASCAGAGEVNFIVTVRNMQVIDESQPCYISTSNNAVYFSSAGDSCDVSVKAHNISQTAICDIAWSCSAPELFEVSANGESATVSALASEGTAVLTVSHPLSENTLSINLRAGNKYEFVNEDIACITADRDTLEITEGQEGVTLTAKLNHTEAPDDSKMSGGFSFRSTDEAVVSVSYVNNSDLCYVTAVSQGTAQIIISHPDAEYEKEVTVIVSKPETDVSVPYITTDMNLVTVIQGEYSPVSVTLVNGSSSDNSAWSWESSNSRTADIVASSGETAMISGNAPGTVEITVRHKSCAYPLKITVICLDAVSVASRPYVKTSDSIVTIQKGKSVSVTAEMLGGTSDADRLYFSWAISSSAVALINPVSDLCYIKAVQPGMAYITVRNTRYSDSYSRTVLVIVEDEQVDGCYIKASPSIIKMKPDSSEIFTVTAELVNGEATDGKDFIWWADDYNMIGITSVAEQCGIQPTGRSGSTKLHVKHPKASKQCDILVMVSDFDTFAFSADSASITAGKLNFFSMQLPAVEDDFKVEYKSSNEGVCIIDGSNAVAFVCGQGYGTAELTADMVSSDGTLLASAQMLVSVIQHDAKLPEISLGQTILTMEAGESRVFSASISGENIDESEKYNLRWYCDGSGGISFLGDDPYSAAGPEVYVNANTGGDYVLQCVHEETGVRSSMWLHVEEKGTLFMELDTNYLEIYMDDGSASLTATVTNGTDSDLKNIEWSAVKNGGTSVVSVSKSKGSKCTVSPKSIGSTKVIARLPNGTKAECTVVVKAAAQITLSAGAVHVIPGYTERIPYTTVPENAAVETIVQFSDYSSSSFGGSFVNYFTVENDSANHELLVTGLKDYPSGAAGTVSLMMVGASAANQPKLSVFVEYNIEVELLYASGKNRLTKLENSRPDTKNEKNFCIRYFPKDLELDINVSAVNGLDGSKNGEAAVSIGNKVTSTVMDGGLEKGLLTVSLIPHTEASGFIKVTGKLPSDRSGQYAKEADFYYDAQYEKYDIMVEVDRGEGAFTSFNKASNTLKLYDGEEALFYLYIAQENAAGTITGIDYTNNTGKTEFDKAEKADVYDLNKDRTELKETVFGSEYAKTLDTTMLEPKTGLIYISQEQAEGASQVRYRIRHCWDYYKELPKKPKILNNISTGIKCNDDDFAEIKKYYKSIDAFLITKEMYLKHKNGYTHYTITKDGHTANAIKKWINTEGDDDEIFPEMYKFGCDGKEFAKYTRKGESPSDARWVTAMMLFHDRNDNGVKGTYYRLFPDYVAGTTSGAVYEDTAPYVLTGEEFRKNPNYFTPQFHFYAEWNDGWDDHETNRYSAVSVIHPYATPTISKDSTDRIRGVPGYQNVNNKKSIITVKYRKGSQNNLTDNETKINVEFSRAFCEANTSGKWNYAPQRIEDGNLYDRWILK